jgi:AcrR family transcriptional regulator
MATETEPRLPLSRDRILRAALALADEQGIESVTMRKLGRLLGGFEAMSLYNHVANKDDLLDGMLDLVLDECEPPAPDGPWDEAVRASAISIHAALRNHAWATPLMMTGGIRPARLRYMDSLLGRLREAGFSADLTYAVYHVLDGHIFGFALWEIGHTMKAEDAAELASSVLPMLDGYPYLREHADQHMNEGAHHDLSAFELGLDLILDGLRDVLGANGRPPAPGRP